MLLLCSLQLQRAASTLEMSLVSLRYKHAVMIKIMQRRSSTTVYIIDALLSNCMLSRLACMKGPPARTATVRKMCTWFNVSCASTSAPGKG